MKSWASVPESALRGVRCVLTDLDDTVSTEGRLTAKAYSALETVQASGRKLIIVTGRPAGWCDHIARMWPVDAVVGENGAFYMRYDAQSRKLTRRFVIDEGKRREQKQSLLRIADHVLREVPGCALASDQAYREADIAIDFCEDVPRLSDAQIARIVTLMEHGGLTAKVSSIHVNGWFGEYDKLSTTQLLFEEIFKESLSQVKSNCVYVGDSPNDAPMFGFFPLSVGVANVQDFNNQLKPPPQFVTSARSGDGFAEAISRLAAISP